MNENELVQLVQAAMSGDSLAGQMLEQLMKSDPSIKGAVEQIIQGLQSETPAMKCGGRVKKKQLGEKIMKAKKASCGCQLKRVGGRLIEVDGCTGLPIHRNGNKIQYARFGDGLKFIGDAIGSFAGRIAEGGQSAWGHVQKGVGQAAQAVTGGERGNGMVRRGQEDIDAAAATGAKVNSAVDNFSENAGNAAYNVRRGVNEVLGPVGWALNKVDDWQDEKFGRYDATTGNMIKTDGTTTQLFQPRYEDQKALAQLQIEQSNEMMGRRSDALIPVKGPGEGPINKIPEPVVAPTGRYSKYGVSYKTDDAGNLVEDWDNTQVSNRDVRRAAIADNRAAYRDNRAQIRNSGMSFAQQQEALRQQRQARRQANQDARNWSRGLQGAYDQSRMADITANVVGYNHNGGLLNYANYLN